jgi:hypothetical protein
MFKKSSYCFTITLLTIAQLSAQKYSNEYLSIGVGARAHAMSGAQAASVEDVYANYWNPAGLTAIDAPLQIGAMHANLYSGVASYDYLGVAKTLNPQKKSVIGFNIVRLGIDNIPYTLNLVAADGSIDYNKVTQFSAADYAMFATYAQQYKGLSIGANVKVVRRVIGSFAGAWGFGTDLGIQYRKKNWRFGILFRDITTTYNAWTATLTDQEKNVFASTNNEIPKSSVEITRPTLLLGAAYHKEMNEKIGLLAELNLETTTDGKRNVLISTHAVSISPRFGLEADFKKIVFLRFGVGNFQQFKNELDPTKKEWAFLPNMGLGLHIGNIAIDYALTNIGNVSQVNYSHIFSLRYNLKPKERN